MFNYNHIEISHYFSYFFPCVLLQLQYKNQEIPVYHPHVDQTVSVEM
jgi:hypothetical protein